MGLSLGKWLNRLNFFEKQIEYSNNFENKSNQAKIFFPVDGSFVQTGSISQFVVTRISKTTPSSCGCSSLVISRRSRILDPNTVIATILLSILSSNMTDVKTSNLLFLPFNHCCSFIIILRWPQAGKPRTRSNIIGT